MKKSIIFVLAALALLIVPLASAGIFDFITGRGVDTSPTDVRTEVGNTAPQIVWVADISAQDAVENGQRPVTFKFEAMDHDNNIPTPDDMSDATAYAEFSKGGETTRWANCTAVGGEAAGLYKNYTCTVGMWYYDAAGVDWAVKAIIQDTSGSQAVNDTTAFTYNSLTAFVVSPASLLWTGLAPGDTNKESSENSVLNNTGNFESTAISINATELVGLIDSSKTIRAENYSSKISAGCEGNALLTSDFVTVTSAALNNGNLSAGAGKEDIYYCLETVPTTATKQNYTTSTNGAWTLKIA